jgi:sulfur transfer protein SufE
MKVEDILINIGLENSITSQRTNGFLSALEKIKKQINKYE